MEDIRLSNRNLNITETYFLANKMLLLFLFLAILYLLFALIFEIGIPCQYKILFGKECRSCGLTRGLSSCMKFDFSQANTYNSQSTFIFGCVVFQIIFRFLLLMISMIKSHLKQTTIKPLQILDVSTIILIFTIDFMYYG